MTNNPDGFPRYPPIVLLASKLAISIIFSRKRSFRLDAINWIKGLQPPLIIHGKENIPLNGRFIFVINHYHRPKYKALWSVLAASAMIPVDIHWVMTEAWTFPKNPIGKYLEMISWIIFRRIAHTYQFFLMPPMPPRTWEVEARASAVRHILSYVKKNQHTAIGLAPEGGDSLAGKLEMPAPGAGRFLLLLAQAGLEIYPLGIYESERVLHLNFGENLDLDCPSETSPEIRDRWCSKAVMHAIAALLPQHLRGVF